MRPTEKLQKNFSKKIPFSWLVTPLTYDRGFSLANPNWWSEESKNSKIL
jgi:hypothetical protein